MGGGLVMVEISKVERLEEEVGIGTAWNREYTPREQNTSLTES